MVIESTCLQLSNELICLQNAFLIKETYSSEHPAFSHFLAKNEILVQNVKIMDARRGVSFVCDKLLQSEWKHAKASGMFWMEKFLIRNFHISSIFRTAKNNEETVQNTELTAGGRLCHIWFELDLNK